MGRTKTKAKNKTLNLTESVQGVTEKLKAMSKQTHEAVVDTWEEIETERKRELIAIPLIAFSLISLLSLLSYSPTDDTLISFGSGFENSVQNWIGWPGACLASLIIFSFGAAGYALPALFLIWGIDRLRFGAQEPIRKFRILGFILLLIATSSFLGLFTKTLTSTTSDESLWRVCGAIGFILYSKLNELDLLGAFIVNLTLMATAALLCTPFLFSDLYQRVSDFFTGTRYEEEELDDEYADEDEDYYDEEEDGYDDYVDEDDEVGENEEAEEDLERTFYGIKKTDRHQNEEKIILQPLRERSEFEEESVVEEDQSLPPLSSSPRHLNDWGIPEKSSKESINETVSLSDADSPKNDYVLPSLARASNNDLKIVTSEEEPLLEIDPGVNLVVTPTHDEYQMPPLSLLIKPEQNKPEVAREEIIYKSQVLEQTLRDFNIEAKVVEVNYGPTITCYEIEPAPGIKISRIENLANDITRSLRAENVRIVAPIPGKGTVGVEVPNINRSDVLLREIIACENYQKTKSKLKIGMGKTITGEPFVFDLMKAPHLLVAGATGSGKSVCINTIICSFMYNAAPHEVKLLMIDPKQVELALYRDIPHLLSPVVTDPKRAGAALRWAVEEMETRYRYLKKAGVRNIMEYNQKRMAQQNGKIAESEAIRILPGFLPYIVIIIDELADLMMVVRAEVEAMIARLAAMARAVGIHLVLATQRPSVDVLTGVIKNNFPARIAFQVSATADSRTILDMKGAESLMGRGDMLLSPGGAGRPVRLQGAYISTEEVEEVVEFVKSQQEVQYVQEEFTPLDDDGNSDNKGFDSDPDADDLYDEAVQCVLENDAASTSLLQRRLKIGYGRAARLLDLMEQRGIVGPPRGSKPREITLHKMQ